MYIWATEQRCKVARQLIYPVFCRYEENNLDDGDEIKTFDNGHLNLGYFFLNLWVTSPSLEAFILWLFKIL